MKAVVLLGFVMFFNEFTKYTINLLIGMFLFFVGASYISFGIVYDMPYVIIGIVIAFLGMAFVLYAKNGRP